MAQSVVINGTTYADVPYVVIPKPSNAGDATFYDCSGDDASAGHVLSGKKFHTSTGDATGSMTNLGSVSDTISTKAGTVTINEGYTSGGTIQISGTEQAKIISDNIKSGVTLLGVSGSSMVVDTTIASDYAAAGTILNGKKAYVNGSLVQGTYTGVSVTQDSSTKVLTIS